MHVSATLVGGATLGGLLLALEALDAQQVLLEFHGGARGLADLVAALGVGHDDVGLAIGERVQHGGGRADRARQGAADDKGERRAQEEAARRQKQDEALRTCDQRRRLAGVAVPMWLAIASSECSAAKERLHEDDQHAGMNPAYDLCADG